MKKKYIIIPLITVFIGISSFFGYKAYISYKNQYTGIQWFEKQKKYVKDMNKYADEMDNVFSLYIIGSISERDFLNHLTILKNELTIMKVQYNTEKTEHPVRTGTHTYSSKVGCEAIENCYNTFDELLKMAEKKENYSDKKMLSYKYLAYQDEFLEYASDYMASELIIKDEKKEKKGEK